jgi:hypothetical protein
MVICKQCGAEFPWVMGAMYCSHQCRSKAADIRKAIRDGRRYMGTFVPSMIMCAACGIEFISRGVGQRYCSQTCLRRTKQAPRRALRLQVKQAKDAAKAAMLQLRVDARVFKVQTQLQVRENEAALRLQAETGNLIVGRCHPATLRGHGVTPEWFLRTLIKQGGCAACGSKAGPWEIDHDHKHCPGATGCPECIRGILCGRCNHAAGNVFDDPDRLRTLAEYLERTGR